MYFSLKVTFNPKLNHYLLSINILISVEIMKCRLFKNLYQIQGVPKNMGIQ